MLICVFTYLLKVTLSFWSVWVCFLGSEGVECPFRLAWHCLMSRGLLASGTGTTGTRVGVRSSGTKLTNCFHNNRITTTPLRPIASPSHIYPYYLSGRLKSVPAGPEQNNSIGVFGAFLAFFGIFSVSFSLHQKKILLIFLILRRVRWACSYFCETKKTLTCDEINCGNLK